MCISRREGHRFYEIPSALKHALHLAGEPCTESERVMGWQASGKTEKESKISRERTFFNYEEGCLGLPYRNLANPCSLYLHQMRATWGALFPALLSQIQAYKGWGERSSSITSHPASAGNRGRGQGTGTSRPHSSQYCLPVHTAQRGWGTAREEWGTLGGEKRLP